MSLSEDLSWRGLVKDKTFPETAWLDSPRAFYHGVDASADSLTVGNLAALLLARRLLDAGWKTVLLVGGGTSLVGDPGGKTEERHLQARDQILNNVESIKKQVAKLFSGKEFELVDNYSWLVDVKYLDFLREVGKAFSMTELMQREFVTERMGEGHAGISYAEFSYSLIQGYDYWQLYKKHKTVLQIGGSDQWGNMLSGVSLIRKKDNQEAHALSMPLIVNKETGQKFGKSEAGAVWLDPKKTTPTQFYQFWINTSDEEVESYLKVFTLLPKGKVEQVISDHNDDKSARKAQKVLAEEVTKLVHGKTEGGSATNVTKYLTGQASIADASDDELREIRKEIPSIKVNFNTYIKDALVRSSLALSKSDARRLIESGAIYINNLNERDERVFKSEDFLNGKLLLRRGKAYKDSALIELE